MSSATVDLPDEVLQRLEMLAAVRKVRLSGLIEEISTGAADQFMAEADFLAMTARADRQRALAILDRSDGAE